MMDKDEIRKLLKRDPLDEAERITGKSYKVDKVTQSLGIFGHFGLTQKRKEAMLASGDTMFSDDVIRYLTIAKSFGFETVLELPFTGKSDDGRPAPSETLYILWRKGILLKFDTYNELSVNGGSFYYNWRFKDRKTMGRYTSSGCISMPDAGVWVGSHDCREALKLHITDLEENGEILEQWIDRPFLWLVHYMDEKGEGKHLKAITEERIRMLPEHVQQAMTPGERKGES